MSNSLYRHYIEVTSIQRLDATILDVHIWSLSLLVWSDRSLVYGIVGIS